MRRHRSGIVLAVLGAGVALGVVLVPLARRGAAVRDGAAPLDDRPPAVIVEPDRLDPPPKLQGRAPLQAPEVDEIVAATNALEDLAAEALREPVPSAIVRGRVFLDGSPARSCVVERVEADELEARRRTGPWSRSGSLRTRSDSLAITDDEGRFELPLEASGTYGLEVSNLVGGGGRGGPWVWTIEDPSQDLVLELGPTGWARGRVVLPLDWAGPTRLSLVSPHGQRQVQELAVDGSFRTGRLVPGTWTLQLERPPSPTSLGPVRPLPEQEDPGEDEELGLPPCLERIVPFTIAPGRTSWVELDCTAPAPFTIRGALTSRTTCEPMWGAASSFANHPARGWTPDVRLWLEREPSLLIAATQSASIPEGRQFELEFFDSGPMRLNMQLEAPEGPRAELTDRIAISEETTRWSREIAWVRVVIESRSIRDEPDVGFRWRGEGDLEVSGRIVKTSRMWNGDLVMPAYAWVPAGPVEIFELLPEGEESILWHVEAREGEPITLAFP